MIKIVDPIFFIEFSLLLLVREDIIFPDRIFYSLK